VMVSPGITMSVEPLSLAVSHKTLMCYLQVFFFFQRRSSRAPASLRPR
jgi:hypothetical protein